MHHIFRIRSKKAGLPPGSLTIVEENKQKKTKISLIEYTEADILEKDDVSIEECFVHLDTPEMTWVQIYGPANPSIVSAIGEHFKLHTLTMEDVLNSIQRPKIDIYDDQLFIIVRYLIYADKTNELRDEQISLIVGPNYLISFSESEEPLFKTLRERLHQPNNRLRKSFADYLAYSILDMVVDSYFLVLEKVDAQLDHLEDALMQYTKNQILLEIQQAKRDMIFLRKSVWPMRDVVNRLLKSDFPHVSPSTKLYIQDVYDHLIQTIDIIEGFRDIVSGMMDIYLSNINLRMNEIMKVLTIVSTIFVPLTFIASLYGMNFEFMPFLHSKWGYTLTIAFMGFLATMMIFFFRRRRWI